MGLIGNGYRHNLTGRLFGATALDGGNPSILRSRTKPAYQRNIFVGEGINSRLASLPSASKHPYSWVMANTAGAIKSFMRSRVEIAASASGELGKPATASGSITITGTVAAGLIVSATGTATIAIDGTAAIVATILGTGQATVTITGAAALGAEASLTGTATLTIDGHSEIMGVGYMTGTTADTTALTPENLAVAVWSALAAANNEAGTMGAKLNSAASGGVDYGALAAAVHGYTVESGLTFEEVTRIIAAALAGTTEKAGSTITFKGLDGTTDRIVGSFDAENNRTGAVLDGS